VVEDSPPLLFSEYLPAKQRCSGAKFQAQESSSASICPTTTVVARVYCTQDLNEPDTIHTVLHFITASRSAAAGPEMRDANPATQTAQAKHSSKSLCGVQSYRSVAGAASRTSSGMLVWPLCQHMRSHVQQLSFRKVHRYSTATLRTRWS
jgi:hypothetical protein